MWTYLGLKKKKKTTLTTCICISRPEIVQIGRNSTHIYVIYAICLLWSIYDASSVFYIGPRQANLVLIAYASSEGSGEPAHPRSLARTFAARSYKQWVKRNLQTESQIPGPSEWLGMRS